MVALNTPVIYDDGPGWPNATPQKERAFRQGFVEEAQRVVRVWAHPGDDFDPWAELATAARTRRCVRDRLGCKPGHEVAAARVRGRHHALVYVTQVWDEITDFETFDQLVLPAWLIAVQRWARQSVRTTSMSMPPPRPLEIEGADVVLQAERPTILSTPTEPITPTLPSERIDTVCVADVMPRPVRWLWPERIAMGKLSLIAGEPGLGKSFLTLDMAARVSRGDEWPCSGGSAAPSGVVLLSAEDDVQDTIRPRLDAARADCRRITAIQAVRKRNLLGDTETSVPFSLIDHLHHLESTIRVTAECRLVIIDPVSAFLGSTDSHNNSEVRGVLAPLSEMAARHGVAVVAVTHLNKGHGSALNRVIGSIAFTAAARAAYVITRDDDDPARRLMLPVKNNLGNDTDGFAYRLEGEPIPRIEWELMPIAMSADEAVGMERKRGPKPDARCDAEAWLLEYLASEPKTAKDVYANAADDGHAKDTVRRAKAVLNVKATKDGYQGAWMWTLPGSGPVMTGVDQVSVKDAVKGMESGLP